MQSKRKAIVKNVNEIKDKRVKIENSKEQTNKIFNYFKSTKSNDEIKKEDIDHSKKISNKSNECEIVSIVKKEENVTQEEKIIIENQLSSNNDSKQAWLKIFKKTEKVEIKNEITQFESVFDEQIKEKNHRKCPFYKFILNAPVTVDAFNYGIIDNCKAYFLSHFHYDHYIGLNKNFQQTLYCSEETANLVIQVIKVNPKYICSLPFNEFQNVFDNDSQLQVALLDANHCPGSAMFLFYFKDTKRYILHTGDFRAGQTVIDNQMLQNVNIDVLYLDTTYCDSYYKFDSQELIIDLGVKTVKDELKKYPNSLIICGSYTIGKERVFTSIAYEIDVKIYVKREKKKILDCLNDEKLKSRLTLNPNETNLHVLPMNILNMNDLNEYLSKFQTYKRIIAIKPTGWTHNSDSGLSVVAKSPNAIIYGLAYSEHSSFNELKTFVKYLKPKRILPTVNNANKANRDKMNNYFQEWLSN